MQTDSLQGSLQMGLFLSGPSMRASVLLNLSPIQDVILEIHCSDALKTPFTKFFTVRPLKMASLTGPLLQLWTELLCPPVPEVRTTQARGQLSAWGAKAWSSSCQPAGHGSEQEGQTHFLNAATCGRLATIHKVRGKERETPSWAEMVVGLMPADSVHWVFVLTGAQWWFYYWLEGGRETTCFLLGARLRPSLCSGPWWWGWREVTIKEPPEARMWHSGEGSQAPAYKWGSTVTSVLAHTHWIQASRGVHCVCVWRGVPQCQANSQGFLGGALCVCGWGASMPG